MEGLGYFIENDPVYIPHFEIHRAESDRPQQGKEQTGQQNQNGKPVCRPATEHTIFQIHGYTASISGAPARDGRARRVLLIQLGVEILCEVQNAV